MCEVFPERPVWDSGGPFTDGLRLLERTLARASSRSEERFCGIQSLLFKKIVPELSGRSSPSSRTSWCLATGGHAVLALVSVFSLFLARLRKIKVGHYMIDVEFRGREYDTRSQPVLEIVPPRQSLNFLHIQSLRHSIRTCLRRSHPVYFESLIYILSPFLRRPRAEPCSPAGGGEEDALGGEVAREHAAAVRRAQISTALLQWILRWSGLEKCLFLDDGRYTNELVLAARRVGVESIGYMHNRFNEFHVGLFHYPFDRYLVWSPYFKDKLLRCSRCYRPDQIVVCGHFRLKSCPPPVPRTGVVPLPVLWIGEANIDYKEMFPFIDALIEDGGFRVLFRGKPGDPADCISCYLADRGIASARGGSLFECLSAESIHAVIGTHSTALLEAWLVEVPPIVCRCSFDYGRHLVDDALALYCRSSSQLPAGVRRAARMTRSEVEDYKQRAWGSDASFHSALFRQALTVG